MLPESLQTVAFRRSGVTDTADVVALGTDAADMYSVAWVADETQTLGWRRASLGLESWRALSLRGVQASRRNQRLVTPMESPTQPSGPRLVGTCKLRAHGGLEARIEDLTPDKPAPRLRSRIGEGLLA